MSARRMTMPMRLPVPALPKPLRISSASGWSAAKRPLRLWSSITSKRPRPKTDPRLLLRLERDRRIRLEFPVIAEIDRIPAAVARPAHAAQRFGMNRKQKLAFADQHIVVIDSGLHRIERKGLRHIPRLHLDSQHAEGFLIDPDRALVRRLVRL